MRGPRACRITGGTLKLVAATCAEHLAGSKVLFEPTKSGLPEGLLASPALVRVTGGSVYVPVVNIGTSDVLLFPSWVLGSLVRVHVISLPAGVTEVRPTTTNVYSQATLAAISTISERIAAVDLTALPELEQGKVKALLRKYQTVFSEYDGDLGCTSLISHDIPLLDDVPVWQRHRRVPPSEYEVVRAHINQLLESQVIRESCSPYASPIVLVKKKDGGLRLCVDYRQLNAKTRRDAFPLARIEESLDALTGACWFSTMDLASGYNQVPVTEGISRRLLFAPHLACLNGTECLLGCAMPPLPSSDLWRGYSGTSSASLYFYI